ncbi:MAG: hypothetical protein LBQ31_00510 [Bacteroidales bacterium]|jgi:hypothetical protein|nr:hypothetical protein [Bacteroidales bacterium]
MEDHYRFLGDAEPTDEQLEMLMREVAEEAIKRRELADIKFQQQLSYELKLAKENYKKLVAKTA